MNILRWFDSGARNAFGKANEPELILSLYNGKFFCKFFCTKSFWGDQRGYHILGKMSEKLKNTQINISCGQLMLRHDQVFN